MQDCCKKENVQHAYSEDKKQLSADAEDKKQSSAILLLIGALLVGAVLVQAYNFTQIGQVNALLEKQATTISLSGNGQTTGPIDMSGWTDDEKMNYEMHGIIPARAQGSATASSANSGANTTSSTANFSEVSPKGVPDRALCRRHRSSIQGADGACEGIEDQKAPKSRRIRRLHLKSCRRCADPGPCLPQP